MLSLGLIVVPTDFSQRSMRALPFAIDLAEKYGAKLRVIFVNEPGLVISDMAWVGVTESEMSKEHREEAQQSISKIVADQVPDDIDARGEVLTGGAVDSIIKYANDHNADLIVMATHGRTGLSHVLMGSIAEQVVRKATCPVLTIKHPT